MHLERCCSLYIVREVDFPTRLKYESVPSVTKNLRSWIWKRFCRVPPPSVERGFALFDLMPQASLP
jgi:hypothetical protein